MAEDQLGQFVNVSVALESAPLTPATFGRACILGPNAAAVGTVYASLEAMVADGIAITDAEYTEAAALIAQSSETGSRVVDWLVGQRSAAVAQVDGGVVTYDAAGAYTVVLSAKGIAPVTIGPVAQNTDADTTATDIANAINGSSFAGRVTAAGTGSGGAYTVTSDQAGIPFTMVVSATGGAAAITGSTTTPNNGIADDLAALLAAGHSWYMTIPVSRDKRELAEAAAWHESTGATSTRIMLAQYSEAAALTGVYDAAQPYADLPSETKALGYNRTASLYHGTDSEGGAAAWAGNCLPRDPGTQTWSAKKLVGVTPDALSGGEVGILTGTATDPRSGKNSNAYIPLNDVTSRTLRGMMASGRRIDEQRSMDKLQNGLTTVIANHILTRQKVPLNRAGIAEFGALITAYLVGNQAGETPMLNPDYEVVVTTPDPSSPSVDRTNRVVGGMSAKVQFSGAAEHVTFNLSVSS